MKPQPPNVDATLGLILSLVDGELAGYDIDRWTARQILLLKMLLQRRTEQRDLLVRTNLALLRRATDLEQRTSSLRAGQVAIADRLTAALADNGAAIEDAYCRGRDDEAAGAPMPRFS